MSKANHLIERWADEARWVITEAHRPDIAALSNLAYEVTLESAGLSQNFIRVAQIINRASPEIIKALMVIAETLFCLGFEAGKKARGN